MSRKLALRMFVCKERLCKELESAKEVHVSEKQEENLQEQEAVASLRKELEAMKLVGGKHE